MLFLDSKISHLSRKSGKAWAGFMRKNYQPMIWRQAGGVEMVEVVEVVEMVEMVEMV